MLRFVLKRLLIWIPSVILILLGVYALAFYGAGDPIKLIFMRAPGDVAYNPARIEAIRQSAGLDKPFFVQFGNYLWNLLHGNFGNSLINGRSVGRMIAAAAPVSLQLGVVTIIITALVGIPLGIWAALRQNTAVDYTILGSALFVWAIPPYVAGPLLMILLVLVVPVMGVPYGWGGLNDARVILPLVVLALQPIALVIRQTRAAVIDVMGEDFIRTARAKGLPEIVVALKHIMRPVLTPVVTQLGIIMISLLNGAIFVELVFGLPGLGRLTVSATLDSDYPVIMAVTLIGAVMVMLSNLLVDLTYPLLDPRAADTQRPEGK
jgi:peptide/nickel transport system permease protein